QRRRRPLRRARRRLNRNLVRSGTGPGKGEAVPERTPLLAVAIALLALAVFVGSLAIGHGIRDRNRSDVITVTGSAKKRITADYVIWNVSVTAQEPSADTAALMLSSWTKQVGAFFHDEHVGGDELTVQPIATEAVTAEDTGQ